MNGFVGVAVVGAAVGATAAVDDAGVVGGAGLGVVDLILELNLMTRFDYRKLERIIDYGLCLLFR